MSWFEVMCQMSDDTSTRHSDWVTNRNSATIWIHFFWINIQKTLISNSNNGKGFVNFPLVNLKIIFRKKFQKSFYSFLNLRRLWRHQPIQEPLEQRVLVQLGNQLEVLQHQQIHEHVQVECNQVQLPFQHSSKSLHRHHRSMLMHYQR